MEKYTINYQNGFTKEIEVADLNEAKEIATEGIRYTQASVTIEQNGEVVSTAHWYGVEPTEDDDVLEAIGGGFYTDWVDA